MPSLIRRNGSPVCAGLVSAGFSFLEVIIVLFLFGAIAGIAFPNFVRLATSSVELQAGQISNYLRDLQAESILSAEPIRMVFDPAKNEIRILYRNAELEWVPHEKFPDPIPFIDGVKIKSIRLQADQFASSTPVNVTVLPSGYIDIFQMEIYDNDFSLMIRTESVLGKVVIEDVRQNVGLL